MTETSFTNILLGDGWQPQAVVLGNGQFPQHHDLHKLLANAPFMVCCDGAAEAYCRHFGNLDGVDAVVGDGDSLSPELQRMLDGRLYIEHEQESNDQTKAMRLLAGRGLQRIALLGATGWREDHTLGNISLLVEYMRQGLDVHMFTDYGVFIPVNGNVRLHLTVGQQISIFSFGATGFQSVGLVWPLHELTNLWQGTLNEASQPDVSIAAQGDYLLFVNYAEDEIT